MGILTRWWNYTDWEQAKQLIIGIDKTPPTIAITAPDSKAYSDSDRLTLQFTAADSLSGVDSIKTTSGSIDNQGIANSLQQKLENGGLGDFINEVNAQSGKHISGDASGYLLRDAKFLISAHN